MYMSYPRLIHDTRKQNKIQPETHCGDTCDMSKSQVRHIHDPVPSINRDRNYNISITMFPCSVLQSLIWELHPYIRFKPHSTALFVPVLIATQTAPSRILWKSDKCYILANVKTYTSNFSIILVKILYKTSQCTATQLTAWLSSNKLVHGLHASRQSISHPYSYP